MLQHKAKKPGVLLVILVVIAIVAWATWTFWLQPASETPSIPTPANPEGLPVDPD